MTRQTNRPIDQLLAIALVSYERDIREADISDPSSTGGHPFMCLVAEDLHMEGEFTWHEYAALKAAIDEWIGGTGTLRQHLRLSDRPSDRYNRRLFYRHKLAELQREV